MIHGTVRGELVMSTSQSPSGREGSMTLEFLGVIIDPNGCFIQERKSEPFVVYLTIRGLTNDRRNPLNYLLTEEEDKHMIILMFLAIWLKGLVVCVDLIAFPQSQVRKQTVTEPFWIAIGVRSVIIEIDDNSAEKDKATREKEKEIITKNSSSAQRLFLQRL